MVSENNTLFENIIVLPIIPHVTQNGQ